MKRNLFILFICLSGLISKGQEPTFRKNFDFTMMDISGKMIETSDGNFLFCGFGTDFLPIYGNVSKIDPSGDIIWSKGISSSISTAVMDVIEISGALGGGYLLAGESSPGAILVRLDNSGNLVWARRYQYPGSQGEFFNRVIETNDGNFLAVGGVYHVYDGSAYRDSIMPMAFKVNTSGTILWDRSYYIAVTNPDEHCFTSASEVSDGYVMTGYTSEGTGTPNDDGDYPRNAIIVKTDVSGNLSWVRRFGSSGTGESIDCATELSTGKVLMGGYAGNYSYLMRLSAIGGTPTIEYQHRYSGGLLGAHAFYDVMEAPDGQYAIIGSYILPLSFSFNSTTAKFNNSTGALISGKTYSGGLTSILPRGGITSTGSYYMMMMSMSGLGHNYHVIKTDVGGVMNNPACPEGDYSPSRSNYTASLTAMTPPAIINTASSSSFTPAIVNLTPGEIVDCEYAPCTPPPVPTLTAVPNPICAGQTVTLTASGSGPNVTYHYYTVPTGGTAFASGPSTDVTPATTTTYYAAAEDNTNPGCMSDRASVTVTVNPNPTVTVSPSAPSICEGGSVSMTASGADSYNWNGLGAGATQNVSPGSTTTYTVTGTTGSCTGSTQVTVTVNSVPVVSITPSSATICSGESVSLTASGADSYNWSGLGAGATQNVSPGSTTTYTVTGTTGACTASSQVTVTVNPSPSVTISPSSVSICQGQSTTLTAGGADTYNWSGLGAGATQNVSPGSTTTYTVTGTTGTCTGSSQVTVTVNTNPVVSISPSSPSICEGNSVSLSASGADSYNWNGLGAGATQNVSPGSTTTYTVTGTTGSCTGSSQVTVTVNSNPVVSISPSAPSICEGQSVVITANGADSYNWAGLGTGPSHSVNPSATTSYTVTGTTGSCTGSASVTVSVSTQFDASITPVAPVCSYENPFNFNAADNGGTWSGNGITDPNNGTFNPSLAGSGSHQIVYTIPGTCGDSDTITIIVNAAPVIDLGIDFSICSGDSAVLDAGAGFSTYNWSPSGSTQTITVNSQNTYTVTVTDNNGCQTSDEVTVSVSPQMNATITSGTEFCSNAGNQNFTAIDGGGVWSGTGVSAGGVFDPFSAGAGVHEIIYTISGSCGDADTVNVTVYAAPTPDLGSDINVCDGDSAVLDAGAGYSSYMWLPSGSSQTITVNTGGTYTVTVTDGNSCQGTDDIIVTIITQQDASIITTGPFCSNDSPVQFTAQDPGGVWSGTGINAGGMFNPTTAGPGTHTITYGIAGNCGDTASTTITVYAAPVVDLGADTTLCEGESLILDAGPGSAWQWSPSGSTQTINVTTGGTYSVTVTDGNTCQGTDAITVSVIDQQDATILTDGPFCSNDSPVQFLSEDGGGSWSGTGISGTGLFNPSTAGPGTHTVTYTIAGTCGDTDTQDIIVNEAPAVSITHNDESCIGAGDGDAVVVITGGTSPYIIIWNTGGDSDSLTGLTPGMYDVLVTDQNGCSNSSNVTILGGTDDCTPPHVYVPNIFSPNGDGENDVLFVRGEGIQYLEFIIYDRWGEKIFETTSKNVGWDGTFKGKMCDPAVFSYILKVIYYNSEEIKFHGTITLVK